MYRVRLVNENVTVSVTGGTLAQACAAAGYPIEQVCGGRGACGKCRVEISRGSVRETVLACRETVLGDVEVYLTPEQASRQVAIVTEGEAAWNRVLCPQVSKRCRTRRELVPEHGRACLPGGEPAVLRRFARLMGEPDLDRMTFVYAGDRLLEVEPGDTAGQLYGAAVDIGTTTLVLYACDLLHGKLCRTESALNGQAVWGADVVSRIRHALEEPGGLEELHESLLRDINSLLEKTGRELPGFLEHLYHIVLCGNGGGGGSYGGSGPLPGGVFAVAGGLCGSGYHSGSYKPSGREGGLPAGGLGDQRGDRSETPGAVYRGLHSLRAGTGRGEHCLRHARSTGGRGEGISPGRAGPPGSYRRRSGTGPVRLRDFGCHSGTAPGGNTGFHRADAYPGGVLPGISPQPISGTHGLRQERGEGFFLYPGRPAGLSDST